MTTTNDEMHCIQVTGSPALARTMSDWFRLSTFADLARAQPARA